MLAQGGMGVVYAAEQMEPVRRRVAIKVIRVGMASPDVVSRFVAERQALAVMSHPNIAQVFDGGVTSDGRPYFVMELVKGVPITEYCDAEKLSTRERLAIFMDVCRAVQHAHQKGVIHRDLKPSNVLVMLQDGKPVPKVIDFGIAKGLAQELNERALVTQAGETIGTPAYMSPEQAEASALDVDTRTDVYSLGVMLFELLVGRLPTDPSEIGIVAFMARLAARDTSRNTPSAALAALGNAAESISDQRHTDPKGLQRELRGDLDWIVMKAMAPDRGRRYETVNALEVDIERHLKSVPVAARPPSTAYRLSRFVRRNRTPVTAAALVVLALVIGLSVAAAGLVKARRAEAAAHREAATAHQVAKFLTDLFKVSNPSEARGDSLTARQILDSAADRINTELADEPLVQAEMLATIGVVYREIGLYREAQPLLEKAVAIRTQRLPPDDSTLQATILELGHLEQRQGRRAEAESLYRQVLTAREQVLDADDPGLVVPLSSLGGLYVLSGRSAEAESVLTRALSLRKRSGAPNDGDYAELLRNLGSAYLDLREFSQAEPVLGQALAMYERLEGEDSPDVARTLSNLGVVYYELGKYHEAERHYQRAEAIFTKTLGPNNTNIASININLGEIAWLGKRYGEALTRLQHALDILHKSVEPGSTPSEGTAEYDLANVLRDEGRFRDAEPHYQQGLRIRESVLGKDSPRVADVLEDYAKLLRATGRSAMAGKLEAQAKSIRRAQ